MIFKVSEIEFVKISIPGNIGMLKRGTRFLNH